MEYFPKVIKSGFLRKDPKEVSCSGSPCKELENPLIWINKYKITLSIFFPKCLGVYKRKHRKKIFKRIERLQMVEDAMMNFNNEIYNREKIYGKYDK